MPIDRHNLRENLVSAWDTVAAAPAAGLDPRAVAGGVVGRPAGRGRDDRLHPVAPVVGPVAARRPAPGLSVQRGPQLGCPRRLSQAFL